MKTLLLLSVFTLVGCASGNYFGDAGYIYTGDKGWIHYKDATGIWHPVKLAATVKPLPECATPIKDMDKCLDSLGLRQH